MSGRLFLSSSFIVPLFFRPIKPITAEHCLACRVSLYQATPWPRGYHFCFHSFVLLELAYTLAKEFLLVLQKATHTIMAPSKRPSPSGSSHVTDHDEASNLMDSSGVDSHTDTPLSEPDDYGCQGNQDYTDDNDNSSNGSSDDEDPDSLFVSDTKHDQDKSNYHSADAAEESDQSSDYGLQPAKKQKTSSKRPPLWLSNAKIPNTL